MKFRRRLRPGNPGMGQSNVWYADNDDGSAYSLLDLQFPELLRMMPAGLRGGEGL